MVCVIKHIPIGPEWLFGKAGQEKAIDHEYILLPFMPLSTQSSKDKDAGEVPYKEDDGVSKGSGIDDQDKADSST
nr:hypothetical protein [Tanacetum cinerariifolium]